MRFHMPRGLRRRAAWSCCRRPPRATGHTETTSSADTTSRPRQRWPRLEATAAIQIGNGCYPISVERERFRLSERKVNGAESGPTGALPLAGMPRAWRHNHERERAASLEAASEHPACTIFGLGNVDRVCRDRRDQLRDRSDGRPVNQSRRWIGRGGGAPAPVPFLDRYGLQSLRPRGIALLRLKFRGVEPRRQSIK